MVVVVVKMVDRMAAAAGGFVRSSEEALRV